MMENSFITKIHRRLATVSIGASAIRNQGAPGLIDIAREYFYKSIALEEYFENISNPENFKIFLNEHTNKLLKRFPENGKSWGAARKGLNLFFREIVYNKFISDYYGLSNNFTRFNETIKYLEVPLDHDVAKGIYDNHTGCLPKWISIKKLTRDTSDLYQSEAQKIAEAKQTVRVHLDLEYWRPITKI